MITKQACEYIRALFASAVLLVFCLVSVPSSTWAASYVYTTLLPAGWTEARAVAINNQGVVVGWGFENSTIKGFMYDGNTYTILLPDEGSDSYAWAINGSGQVTGAFSSLNFTGYEGFVYSGGVYTEFRPTGWLTAHGRAINNAGVVAGDGEDKDGVDQGLIYDPNDDTYTGVLPDDWFTAYLTGINDSGVVVGIGDEEAGAPVRGFMYDEGTYTTLLPSGWYASMVNGINNSGVVVGTAVNDASDYKGFTYSEGVYTEVLPPGWSLSTGYGINNNGDVVGTGFDGSLFKSFIYRGGAYTELLPSGWDEVIAIAVNDNAVVTGYVVQYGGGSGTNDVFKAFIATPSKLIIDGIISFFELSVSDGYLTGVGSTPVSAAGKLSAFEHMLKISQDLIERDSATAACQHLLEVYKKTDGSPSPPDFIDGPSRSELAGRIQALRTGLEC